MTQQVKQKREKIKLKENRLKEFLGNVQMSQQELADETNTNKAHISKIINKKGSCISLPMALKIAKVLKTNVETLFILE
jgi:plasmid maintenance system antidote protein VapI